MDGDKSIAGCKMLSTSEIQQIFQLPPLPAKEFVAEKLSISPYNDPKDPQKAPFINYIYDNIIFAAEKGFPWNHVGLVVRFAHEFLKSILVEKHRLPDAIKGFAMKADILDPLSERHKKQYADYVTETVLCHYNLYKYVFSHLRETVKPKMPKEVVVPPVPLALSKGQSVEVWEYQQKIKAVEVKQVEALEKMRGAHDSLKEKLPPHKSLNNLDDVPVPYNKMSLEELIADVLKGFAESKQLTLKCRADAMVQDLGFKLEKTVIPRPAVMGEPQRFKPKSPPSTGKGNKSNNNELKVEKGSARSARSQKSGRSSSKSKK